MRANLVAVQADMRLEHYLDAERFHAKIEALTRMALDGLEPLPTLLCFPETIGFPLVLTLADPASARALPETDSFGAAARRLARRRWRELLAAAWRWRRLGPDLLYLPGAVAAHRVYVDAFAGVARRHRVTVVAGSAFLPLLSDEPAGGLRVVDPRVTNRAFVFGPSGALLGRSSKVQLMPLEQRAGLRGGRLDDLGVVQTPLGRLGVAICLDGFHSAVLERLDGLGAVLLAQPSANHAPWERPWPPDPGLSEGEAWLQRGLRRGIQGREHLRYGVNAMMVGEVLDLRPRGRSSIVVNERLRPAPAPPSGPAALEGVVALARSADREEAVRATVELPGGAAPRNRDGG